MSKSYREDWLPHLENCIPPAARFNRTSLYTIALEGWRRGLGLKFSVSSDNNKIQQIKYSLSDGHKEHFFTESNGDMNTVEAEHICKYKNLTYEYLEEAGVPVPKGKNFNSDHSIDEMLSFGKEMTYPIVVKPADGGGGHGVVSNIRSDEQLEEALHYVRKKLRYENVILQEFIAGDEVRIYVLGDRVLSAVNRIPANVIGDGKNSITKLIELKNEFRKGVTHLHHRPILLDSSVHKLLKKAGYTLDTVLKKGEQVFLREVSNVSTGGDPIEIGHELTSQQKEIAIKATKAIPGLEHSGVDLMINKESVAGVVIEVNIRPGIGNHLFPIKGKAVDIPKALLDHYFPETKEISINSQYYFDLQTIFDSLLGGYNNEVEVLPCPTDRRVCQKVILYTNCEPLKLYNRLESFIFQYGLNGFIEKRTDNRLDLVISSNSDKAVQELVQVLEQSSNYLNIVDLEVEGYFKPIKLGFEMIDDLNEVGIIELEKKEKISSKNNEIAEKEIRRLSHRIKLTEDSFSWKLTSPLRRVLKQNNKKED